MDIVARIVWLLISNIVIVGFMHILAPDEYETIVDLITFIAWSIIYSVMLYNYDERS